MIPAGALPKNFPVDFKVDHHLWVLLAWVASLSPAVEEWELRLIFQESDQHSLWLQVESDWRQMTALEIKNLVLKGLKEGLRSQAPQIQIPRPPAFAGCLRINSQGLRSFETQWPKD